MAKSTRAGQNGSKKALERFQKGLALAQAQPLLRPLLGRANVTRSAGTPYPQDGWATVTKRGAIYVHPERVAEPEEWLYVLAHCLLHLGLGHFQERFQQREWDLACECALWQFLATLRLGRPPEMLIGLPDLPARTEEALFRQFCEQGVPAGLPSYSLTGTPFTDMLNGSEHETGTPYRFGYSSRGPTWEQLFALGLSHAVTDVVDLAGGAAASGGEKRRGTAALRAREWFITSYPLLGALAASFTIIEDVTLCSRMQISVAAVSEYAREIYVNPGAGLTESECRFVLAHELLHVSLRHSGRCQGRDAFLWNVACDYVINQWLTEMQIGSLPQLGLLLDPELKGLSAEAIYDRIVTDLRRHRRLGTFRGVGLGDILDAPSAGWWLSQEGMDLDAFYRSCLSQGLLHHHEQGRGFLPAGLLEEIQALHQPAIPWEVELARWLDDRFPPIEQRRTYARPSRRQSSTPDIPRPHHLPLVEDQEARTFGVVLDTSGSMSRVLLAESLGAIASYCESREVRQARVIFCDAQAYDAGYLAPGDIAGRVQVRGRGGTVLQPGLDLLEHAEDFPRDGPVLIITDGFCDHFRTRRDHAILLAAHGRLPFTPQGKVFRLG